MADGIEIRDVQIAAASEPAPGFAKPGFAKPGLAKIDIAITFANNAADTTYQAIAEPVSTRYDEASHTLSLELSEPEADPLPGWHIHGRPPRTISLAPGETRVLHVIRPGVLDTLIPDGLNTRLEKADLTRVQHVECTVAYNETPFYPVPSEPGHRMHDRLRNWGRKTKGTFDRSLPDQQG